MVLSHLIALGRRALTDVRISVAVGEPLVQRLASELYEALKRELRAPELKAGNRAIGQETRDSLR